MSPSFQASTPHGLMEGHGAYNRHAAIQAGGIAVVIPILEEAVRNLSIEPGDRPVIVADYGCSQGKNSLRPLQVAIRNLQPRLAPDRPLLVMHVDQPSNDFASLFEVLHSHPDRYAHDSSNVFSCAVGKSFYEQVVPDSFVDFGWSSYAAVWLSRIPGHLPGHFIAARASDAARAPFATQAARDWSNFLALRARELTPGGRLVVALPGLAEDGSSGLEMVMDCANAVLADMVRDGVTQEDERAQMVIGSYPRRNSEILAPFRSTGEFAGLTVERCELLPVADAAWEMYLQDGDARVLAQKHAMFFRSTFAPSLASAIGRLQDSNGQALEAFADHLADRLAQKLAANPSPVDSLVQIIVLEKRALPTRK